MQQSWLSTASSMLMLFTFPVLSLFLWWRRALPAPSRRWTMGWSTVCGSLLVAPLTLLNVRAQQPDTLPITRVGIPIYTIAIVVGTNLLLLRAWWSSYRRRVR